MRFPFVTNIYQHHTFSFFYRTDSVAAGPAWRFRCSLRALRPGVSPRFALFHTVFPPVVCR